MCTFAENKRPFSVSVCSKKTEVCRFRLQKTSCRPFIICRQRKTNVHFSFSSAANKSVSSFFHMRNSGIVEIWSRRHGRRDMDGDIKRKTEAPAIFINPFTVCTPCKRKFVVCLFVDEETNGSYPFANGLYGLAHLCARLTLLA